VTYLYGNKPERLDEPSQERRMYDDTTFDSFVQEM
jgi:hypothetical protein